MELLIPLKEMIENDYIVYKRCHINNRILELKLEKAEKNIFFIKAHFLMENGEKNNVGYIYFKLDYVISSSEFIGLAVNRNHRGNGFASFLISEWLDLCFSERIFNIKTQKRQIKPFLIYLLKTFGFEFDNMDLYDKNADSVIRICRSEELLDTGKYLIFNSEEYRKWFESQAVAKDDNYITIEDPGSQFVVLDRVLLNHTYHLQEPYLALKRIRKTQDRLK